jgi:hypothetical protein
MNADILNHNMGIDEKGAVVGEQDDIPKWPVYFPG